MVGKKVQGHPGPVVQGSSQARELVFSLLNFGKPRKPFEQEL